MAEDNNGHQTKTCVGEQGGVWYVGEGNQEGFFFREYKKYRGQMNLTIYVYCVRKWQGKIVINNAGIRGPLILTEILHNHGIEPDQLKTNEVRQRLMKRAAAETVPLKLIYDQELAKESAIIGGLRLSYVSVFAAMQKRRQRAQPRVPDTILELVKRVRRRMPQWLRTLEGTPFLIAFKEDAMLFASPTTKLLLGNNDLLFTMDGTFKVTPNKPNIFQLYTLGAVYCDVFIPIAFGLLQNKTAAMYQWMFEELKKLNVEWDPRMLMTDYEAGAITAIEVVFPNARHIGCWFHYSKAIQKKCGKLHLIQEIRANGNLKRAIRKLMALPLLPAEQYIRGFEIIEEECQQFLNIVGLAELLHYMRTFWIQRITPDMISVHGAPARTNNLQEAFHGNITLHVSDSRRMVHPRFWRFLNALQLMERDAHIKLLAAAAGKKVNFPKKARWALQHQRIRETTDAFNVNMGLAQNIQDMNIRADLEWNFTKIFLERAKYFFNFPEVEEVPPVNANEQAMEIDHDNLANEVEDANLPPVINGVLDQVADFVMEYEELIEIGVDDEEEPDDDFEVDEEPYDDFEDAIMLE